MTFYLSGAGAYCAFLLFSKFSDKECSKTDFTSWLAIVIASTFWLIVIPISLIELKTKAKPEPSEQNADEEMASYEKVTATQRTTSESSVCFE